MAIDNMQTPSDGEPSIPVVNTDALFEDLPKEMLRLFKEVEKYVTSISKKWTDALKETRQATGDLSKNTPGSGRLGLGSFSTTEKVGLGLGLATMGYMSATPNTMAAVTQRIAADSYAGLSGMSSRQAIMQANRLVGGGVTSAMGPTMAAMNLFYQGGYTASSLSSKNIMGSLAGLSAMTGMTNEQAASSVAGINGMSFLRMGIRVRDNNGNLRPIGDIVNDVYNFLYRGQKITKEQAALVYNPGSKGYQTLSMIAGGDSGLMQALQAGVVARASASSGTQFASAMSSRDPNQMLNIMGVDQSSPLRRNFKFQTSQANVLQATEQGLVGGYNTALDVASAANNGLATFANLLGPINQGLMTLKGILETLPGAGNVGGTISGAAGAAIGLGKNYLQYKMLGRLLEGGGARAAGTSLLSKGKGLLGRIGSWLGKEAPVIAEDAAIIATGGPSDHGGTGSGGASAISLNDSKVHYPISRNAPITQNFARSGHTGVDFGIKLNSPVYAYADGIVTHIGNEPTGYGNWIEISHPELGIKTRYGHLKSISVTRKQVVTEGQIIGTSGSTGRSKGPHLHFEVLVNNQKVDPEKYLNATNSSGKKLNSKSLASRLQEDTSNSLAGFKARPFRANNGKWVFPSYNGSKSGAYNAGFIVNSGTGTGNAEIVKNFLVANGLTTSAGIGVVGNLLVESGVNPNNPGDYGTYDARGNFIPMRKGTPGGQYTSGGIAQWHASRYDLLTKFAQSRNLDPLNLTTQEQFMMAELKRPQYAQLFAQLRNPNTTEQAAADMWMRQYEKPNLGSDNGVSNSASRAAAGLAAFKTAQGGPTDHGNMATVAHIGGSYSSGGSATLNSRKDVHINLNMKVYIANASVQQTEALVNAVSQKLKNSEALKMIASSL